MLTQWKSIGKQLPLQWILLLTRKFFIINFSSICCLQEAKRQITVKYWSRSFRKTCSFVRDLEILRMDAPPNDEVGGDRVDFSSQILGLESCFDLPFPISYVLIFYLFRVASRDLKADMHDLKKRRWFTLTLSAYNSIPFHCYWTLLPNFSGCRPVSWFFFFPTRELMAFLLTQIRNAFIAVEQP